MKKAKIIIATILCLVLCALMSTTAFAQAKPTIVISNEAAFPGEEVTVDVSITNNPGIMCMTFSITYDNTQFEFVEFSRGFISTPTYKDHSDKGYIAFSISETSNKTNVGNIMSLTFKIKNSAKSGKHPINLGNHYYEKYGNNIDNCFANSNEDLIVPTIKSGSITVKTQCDKTGHNYSNWSVSKQPSCTETGLKIRTCSDCGDTQEIILDKVHDFESDWTVDKAATKTEDGIMSRHCKNCNAVTDQITFSYEEIGGEDADNSSSDGSDESSEPDESNPSEDASGNGSVNDNDSSGSQTQDGSSTDSSTDNSSGSSTINKPNINNTVGEKVPLSEVQKFDNYKETVKPQQSNENSSESENDSQSKNSSQEDNSSNQTASKETQSNEDLNVSEENTPSFFATPTGIIMLILCILLSGGIIAFAVILILKNRKSN